MGNSTIVKLLLAAVLVLGLTTSLVRAETPSVNFDQTPDVSAILSQARQAAPAMKAAPAGFRASDYYEKRCGVFSFGPNDPARSQTLRLYSTEWRRECYSRGGDPRHGGGWECYDRRGRTYREDVRVSLKERKPLLPWETDTFEVCLEGPWLDVYNRETAYEYKIAGRGAFRGDFIMAPGQKKASKPDASGITLQSFSSGLSLTLADKWAAYYQGERTGLKVKLKDNGWFGGSTVFETELTVPAAVAYQVNLADLAKKAGKSLKAGDKYYAKFEWRRVGKISKNDWMKEKETDKVHYQPSAGPAVGR